jgi:hypothetical protein
MIVLTPVVLEFATFAFCCVGPEAKQTVASYN